MNSWKHLSNPVSRRKDLQMNRRRRRWLGGKTRYSGLRFDKFLSSVDTLWDAPADFSFSSFLSSSSGL